MANLMSSSAKLVVFLDELWIYSKGNKIRYWQDDTIKSVRKPEGYDGNDYRSTMDGRKFEGWVPKQLIPNLPPNSVVVMDNAPYHSVVTNKIPNTLPR
ncbi:hypothetical protein Trydic_g20053 [Trypoxylus dichotomus]